MQRWAENEIRRWWHSAIPVALAAVVLIVQRSVLASPRGLAQRARTAIRQILPVICLAVSGTSSSHAANYDPGASDTEIKIGSIMPYSGPASAYATIGKTEAAYFDKINDEGGINGRKIKFISYDDASSPPKTVERTRKLIEGDEVLFIFGALGTASNSAIHKYLNHKKIPQLFIATGATKWGDPKNFPWTMGWQPNYQSEGRIYAQYILRNYPNGKIAAIWQNDDAGKDQMKGLRDGLGDRTAMIVADAAYEISDPTIDSQIAALKDSGADILVAWTSPKAAAQAIRKVAEIGWKPVFILSGVSTSVAAVLKPAGLENAKGIISTAYLKDPTDPAWKVDPGIQAWLSFMNKYYPNGEKNNVSNVLGYAVAQTLVQVLIQCGDDLSRANVMKEAANLHQFSSDVLLPRILINTSPTDFFPIEQMQMMKFEGESWKLFGDIIDGEVSH